MSEEPLKCERCGVRISYDSSDYCAVCSDNLCDHCMAKGHCGHKPAQSGLEADDRK